MFVSTGKKRAQRCGAEKQEAQTAHAEAHRRWHWRALGGGEKRQIEGGRPQADLYEGVWSARKKNGRKTRRQRSPDTGTQVRMVCVGGVDGARPGTRPGKKWKAERG